MVVAVSWHGLLPALALVGAAEGRLSGKTVIDCTNPVDYATGNLIPESGSAAQLVAATAAGAHVVKALHLFAGASWPYAGERELAQVVAICGDHQEALDQAKALIADLGGHAAVVGGLASARQLEEAAGFVMRVVAAGANPRRAVPDVEPRPWLTLRRPNRNDMRGMSFSLLAYPLLILALTHSAVLAGRGGHGAGDRPALPAAARRGAVGPVRPAADDDRLRHRARRPAGRARPS